MKTTSTALTFAAAALLVTGADATAQTASGTVNASATVLAYLDVNTVAHLDLGSITPGAGATVTPGAAVGAGQAMGVLKLDHNADVIVAAALPAGLSLAGAPDLPVSFSCGYSTASSGGLDGAAADCTALPNRTGNGDGSTRTSYIQLGGSILGPDTTGRIPGTYTGSVVFTVTATY